DGRFKLFAEHWNGSGWNLVDTPDGAGYAPSFRSVAVAAPDDVWAVGSGSGDPSDKGTFSFAFAQRFVGAGWQRAGVPRIRGAADDDALNAVVARGATDVWSAGKLDGRPVSEHWDGQS